jgi:hypothetical protein
METATAIRDAYGGMHDWRVRIRHADNPGEDDAADGWCRVEWRYRLACIEVRRDLPPEREREVIAHELAHVFLASIDAAIDRISELVPPRHHEHVQGLYLDALEPVCEQLSRAVLALLPPEPTS